MPEHASPKDAPGHVPTAAPAGHIVTIHNATPLPAGPGAGDGPATSRHLSPEPAHSGETVGPASAGSAKDQATAKIRGDSRPEQRQANPASILTVDIGGTKVKILATGQTEARKASSGKSFTPARLVETVRELASDWSYDAISIGYPGQVGLHGPRSEPGNLGPGWVGFDFARAFDKPVKMVNDAAMQAMGSYEGGRMLFLGLGTGLGSALITGHVVVPLELGQLPYDCDRTFGEVLGRKGLERVGKKEWRGAVHRAVTSFMGAFIADYVVIGGGNAKNIKDLPPGSRLGHNQTAFRGGFRLWNVEDVWILAASGEEAPRPSKPEELRMV